jgi:hypothetical protein
MSETVHDVESRQGLFYDALMTLPEVEIRFNL